MGVFLAQLAWVEAALDEGCLSGPEFREAVYALSDLSLGLELDAETQARMDKVWAATDRAAS